jgi:hypothetical protein
MRNSKLQYIFLVSKHADQEQALQAYWHVQILCCLAISHLTKPPTSRPLVKTSSSTWTLTNQSGSTARESTEYPTMEAKPRSSSAISMLPRDLAGVLIGSPRYNQLNLTRSPEVLPISSHRVPKQASKRRRVQRLCHPHQGKSPQPRRRCPWPGAQGPQIIPTISTLLL